MNKQNDIVEKNQILKPKTDDLFGDDNDHLRNLSDNTAEKTASQASRGNSGSSGGMGFMEDMLSGGPNTPFKNNRPGSTTPSRDFVLDDKYKGSAGVVVIVSIYLTIEIIILLLKQTDFVHLEQL